MRLSLFLIILSVFLLPCNIFAQYYDTGQDPSSLRWMQIKTGRFTVIYPEKYDQGGRAFAQSLEDAYSKMITIFPERKFRIPVVIHSFSTGSNGYVAWAPKRMEIYPTPEQNTIPLDPNKQLQCMSQPHVFEWGAKQRLLQGYDFSMGAVTGICSTSSSWFLEGMLFLPRHFSDPAGQNPHFETAESAYS
jgi:hypothetical protein